MTALALGERARAMRREIVGFVAFLLIAVTLGIGLVITLIALAARAMRPARGHT